jgi:hypothetical protein
MNLRVCLLAEYLRRVTTKERDTLFLIFCAAVLVLIFFFAVVLNVGYYTKADLYGPVSRFPTVFVPFAVVIALAMGYIFRRMSHESEGAYRWLLLFLPLALIVVYLLFLPDAIERYVATNYYDTPAHIARTVYLLNNGRINVSIDSYFDLQPGVFFSTAAFMLVAGIGPEAISKWFPLFFVALAYVPAVIFLGKSYFKNARELSIFVFLTLAIMWPSPRYHYSAQIYVLPLIIIVAGLLLRGRLNRERFVALFVLSAAMIPIHQAASLFTLAMFASFGVFKGVQRFLFRRAERSGAMLGVTMLFLLIWLGYLLWVTVDTFGTLVGQLRSVVSVLASGLFAEIFSRDIVRPNPFYQTLVYSKIAFTAIIYLLSLPVPAYLWLKGRISKFGDVLAIVLGTSAVIYILGFSLGGIGYVERAVLMTSPLLAVGIAIVATRTCRINSLPVIVMLVLLVVPGGVLFNSSRNFQSWLYSEQASTQFVESYQSIPTLVWNTRTVSMPGCSYTETARFSVPGEPHQIIMLLPSCAIEASYWETGAVSWADSLNNISSIVKFYSNGPCSTYVVA